MLFFAVCALSVISPQTISVDMVTKWESAHLFDQYLFYINDRHPVAIKEFFLAATEGNKLKDETELNKIAKSLIPYNDFLSLKSYIELGYYFARSVTFKSMARTSEPVLITGDEPKFESNYKYVNREHQKRIEDEIVFGISNTIVYADFSNEDVIAFVRSLLENNKEFILRPITKTNEPNHKLTNFAAMASLKDLPTNESDPFGEWNESTIEDFDLKLTQYILDSKKQLPATMKEITNNWPKIIRELLTIRPTSTANRTLNAIRGYLNSAGTLASSINGRVYAFDNPDIHEIFNILNEENTFNKILTDDLKLTKNITERIVTQPLEHKNNFLLDYRNNYVKFFNNIETDPNHITWSTSVQELLKGQPKIRKNLINIIAYTDPTTQQGFTSIFSIATLVHTGLPVRLGLVPNFNMRNRLFRRVAFAFHHIAKQSDSNAFLFLYDTFHRAGVNRTTNTINPATEEMYAAAYAKITSNMQDMLPWERLHELYTPLSEEYQDIKATSEYITKAKVPFGYMTINGKIFDDSKKLPEFFADMIRLIFEACTMEGIMDLQGVDLVQLLGTRIPVVKELGHDVFEGHPEGTGLSHSPYDTQKDFIDFFEKTDFEGPQNPLSYSLLFCDPNSDTTFFTDIMAKDRYLAYAINPKLNARTEQLFGLKDEDLPAIITNGRIFRKVNMSDEEKLTDIRDWASNFMSNFKPALQRVQGRFVALAYTTTMHLDFMGRSIPRIPLPDFSADSFLIYSDKDNKDAISWKILADPTRANFQASADIIEYVNRKGLCNIQLMVMPPKSIHPLSLECVRRFFRTSLGAQKLTFKFLDTELNYSITPLQSYRYSVEKIYSEINDTHFSLSAIDDGDLKLTYGVDSIFSTGKERFTNPLFLDIFEVDLVDTSDPSKHVYVPVDIQGQWMTTMPPGQYAIKMREGRNVHTVRDVEVIDTTSTYKSSFLAYVVNGSAMMNSMQYNGSFVDINIFTVAATPMQEKMTLVMLLSAKEHSDGRKIHVWFNLNDISSNFKAILPKFAADHGITVHYLDYKWPQNIFKPESEDFSIGARRISLLDLMFPNEIGQLLIVTPDTVFTKSITSFTAGVNESAPFIIPQFNTFKTGATVDFKTSIKNVNNETFATNVVFANLNVLRTQAIIFDALRKQILVDILKKQIPSPDFDLLNILGSLIHIEPAAKKVACADLTELDEFGAMALCTSPSKLTRMTMTTVEEKYENLISKYLVVVDKYNAERDDYMKEFLK